MINDVFGACRVISNQHSANVMHFGNKTPTLPQSPVIEKKKKSRGRNYKFTLKKKKREKKKKLALLGLC